MFFGMKPFLIISDADLLKDITVKHFDKFANRMVSTYIYSLSEMYILQCVIILLLEMGICLEGSHSHHSARLILHSDSSVAYSDHHLVIN